MASGSSSTTVPLTESSTVEQVLNLHPKGVLPVLPKSVVPPLKATQQNSDGPSSEKRAPHEVFANTLFSFSSRFTQNTLFSGEHYKAIANFLVPNVGRPPPQEDPSTRSQIVPSFVTVHAFGDGVHGSRRRHVSHLNSPETLEEQFNRIEGNKIVFMKGYPSPEWLSRLGHLLDLDYEFLYQHFSNNAQLTPAESYSLPPLSLITSGTIQLTFTSIGTWDNLKSEIGLADAREKFYKSMKRYVEDLNRGGGEQEGPGLCHSIVREFHLHDLKHFSIEQKISIKCLQHGASEHKGAWIVPIWIDCATSLRNSHPGPWCEIERHHSTSSRFLPLSMYYSNSNIKKLLASARKEYAVVDDVEKDLDSGPLQTLSFLATELGRSIDTATASKDPFYAIDEVFRLLAASEHQFLNLMEEKTRETSESVGDLDNAIAEIQSIKRLVVRHSEQLLDVTRVIMNRGGVNWPQITSGALDLTENRKAIEAAECLNLIFRKLLRKANTLSQTCTDEITKLGNDAMVKEAQRSIRLAESINKVTFIAFIFVPLSFTTSFFGMDLKQWTAEGEVIWLWVSLSVPVMLLSLLAWWINSEKQARIRKFLTRSKT